MATRWQPGEHVTLRYVGHLDGREPGKPGLLQALPHIVVEDSDEALVLWMPAGSRRRYVDLSDRSRVVPDEVWRADTLRVMVAGRPYSVMLFWTPGAATEVQAASADRAWMQLHAEQVRVQSHSPGPAREFLGWYVNLEAPFVRTAIGVDTTDNSLDVVVAPDRTWRWKDEHLTRFWIDAGAYTEAETARLYADGRDAIGRLEAGAFPFDGSFVSWRPAPHWGVPDVHASWATLEGYDVTLTTGRRLPWTDAPRRQGG